MLQTLLFMTLIQNPLWIENTSTVSKTVSPAQKSKDRFVSVQVAGVIPQRHQSTLILADAAGKRVVPIGIGETAAISIHLRLENRRYHRPLTHDLLDSMMARFGGKVTRAEIHHVRGEVFFGSLSILRDGKIFTMDARPSDAIALAIGQGAPVFVAESVFEDAGIDEADLAPEREQRGRTSEVIHRL